MKTKRFYEQLSALLEQQIIATYQHITGVTLNVAHQQTEYADISELLSSPLYTEMIEEIENTHDEQSHFLRDSIKEHIEYYNYLEQETALADLHEKLQYRKEYMQKRGVSVFFASVHTATSTTDSLEKYSKRIQDTLQRQRGEYGNPGNLKAVEGDDLPNEEQIRNDVLEAVVALGLNKDCIRIDTQKPDLANFEGGYSIMYHNVQEYQLCCCYSPSPNPYQNGYVLAHELGHLLYYQSISAESPEISNERSALWNECVAESVALYVCKRLQNKYPQLFEYVLEQSLKRLEYADILLRDIITLNNGTAITSHLQENIDLEICTYSLQEPFRQYVAEVLCRNIETMGADAFRNMITGLHLRNLNTRIEELWQEYLHIE